MKNISQKFMTFVAMTIIPFGVLLLVHKFIFKSENWVLEPLTFMIGWMLGYFATIIIKTMSNTYSTSKAIGINILCSIVVVGIAVIISLIFNMPSVHSYAFRAAFAFVCSIFSNSLTIGNRYAEVEDDIENEADEDEYADDDF